MLVDFNKVIDDTDDYLDAELVRLTQEGVKVPDREALDVYIDNREHIVLKADNTVYPYVSHYQTSVPSSFLNSDNGWSIWKDAINDLLRSGTAEG